MADRQIQDDLSMDDYFENGTLRESPTETEASTPRRKKSRVPSGKRKKRAALGKRFLMISCVVVALGLIIGLSIYVTGRKNDGARYAQKFSLCIGNTIQDAKSNVKLALTESSDYTILNHLNQPFAACAVSKKQAEVQGVTLPEWSIICRTDGDILTEVWYYSYEVLEDNPYGIERKAYFDPSQVAANVSPEQAEDQMKLSPYCIRYQADHTQIREYRYCFEDAETGDLTAYIITGTWDTNDELLSLTDRRVDFLTAILKSTLA